MNTREKILKAESVITKSLIQREKETRLLLVSTLIKEHLLLIGLPGTAKSQLLNTVGDLFKGNIFSTLLSKFTVPEELFGPLDISKLRESIYERQLRNGLAEANFAFLDEVFKSSSAVLNMLLGVLNERKFKNNGTVTVPLRTCVGASNEGPSLDHDQKDLHALFDRFLIRKLVDPISGKVGLKKLINSKDEDLIPKFEFNIELEELDNAFTEIKNINPSKEFTEAYIELIQKLKSNKPIPINPGDRRIRKSILACKAEAWLDGQEEIKIEHGSILQHTLWTTLEAAEPSAVKEIVETVFRTTDMALGSIITEAQDILDKVDASKMSSIIETESKLRDLTKKLESRVAAKDEKAIEAVNFISESYKELRKKTIEL